MLLLLVHAGATLAMVGVIWFVQVVHYPLFAAVGAREFTAFERENLARTTRVVAPLMLVEAAAAAALVVWPQPGPGRGLPLCGLALLLGVWLSTALIQVPAHRRLGEARDPAVIRALVRGNWLRTWLWTARGALALLLLGGVA